MSSVRAKSNSNDADARIVRWQHCKWHKHFGAKANASEPHTHTTQTSCKQARESNMSTPKKVVYRQQQEQQRIVEATTMATHRQWQRTKINRPEEWKQKAMRRRRRCRECTETFIRRQWQYNDDGVWITSAFIPIILLARAARSRTQHLRRLTDTFARKNITLRLFAPALFHRTSDRHECVTHRK